MTDLSKVIFNAQADLEAARNEAADKIITALATTGVLDLVRERLTSMPAPVHGEAIIFPVPVPKTARKRTSKSKGVQCKAECCGERAHALGLCEKHYDKRRNQLKKKGLPTGGTPHRKAEPSIRSEPWFQKWGRELLAPVFAKPARSTERADVVTSIIGTEVKMPNGKMKPIGRTFFYELMKSAKAGEFTDNEGVALARIHIGKEDEHQKTECPALDRCKLIAKRSAWHGLSCDECDG